MTAPSSEKRPKLRLVGISVEAEEQVDAEVDEEDLDEQRRAAEDQHVEAGEHRSGRSRDMRMSAAIRPSTTPMTWATTAM